MGCSIWCCFCRMSGLDDPRHRISVLSVLNGMSAKRYAIMLLCFCASFGAAGILLNLAVDPYGSNPFVQADNVARPAIYRRVKLAKAYDIRRIRPEAIVLGSSRSHLALRMSHPGWAVPPTARYNAAFDGATT